jgi:O-antigen/teichoic acid export membrane protein
VNRPARGLGAPAGGVQRPAQAPLASVARGGAANLTGALVSALANFALAIAITRGLPKADAGVFFSTTSLFVIATVVGQLGTNTGLVYFLPRARVHGRPELIGSYVRTALRPVLVTGVVVAAAVFFLAPQIAETVTPGHVERATGLLRVLALFVPLAGAENVLLAATRGLGTMRAYALVEMVARPLLQLALVSAVVVVAEPAAVGWAWAAAYLPAAAAAMWWWRRLRRGTPGRGRPPAAGVADETEPSDAQGLSRRFWRFSGPRALTSVVQVAMQRLDIVLVGALAGAPAAAVYTAATRFIVAGQMGTNALALAVQPRLAHSLAQGDRREVQHLYQVSTAWVMVVTWPMYLTFCIFGEPLLSVFGKGYQVGAPVMLLLSLSMLLSTGFGMVDGVLSMAGHTSWNLANAVLALVVQVGLDLWLIPQHGVLGAAIGWATAIAVRNVAALTQVGLALRLHPFGPVTAAAAGLAVVAFFAVPGAVRLVWDASVPAAVVAVLAGGVVYLLGIARLRGVLELSAMRAIRRRQVPDSTAVVDDSV